MYATIATEVRESYEAALSELERDRFRSQIQTLLDISGIPTSVPQFLSEYGQAVAELFAATSVSIWFACPSGSASADLYTLQRKVSVGGENLLIDEVAAPAHELLLQHVLTQGEPCAVHPFSTPSLNAGISNPTDSFLLLSPIKYLQRDVALLEIALGPKPLRRPHRELVSAYMTWLRWLSGLLQTGIERSFSATGQPILMAMQTLTKAAEKAQQIQRELLQQLEASLVPLAEKNFGSLSANQTVAKQVHSLLESKGLRVRCPECGHAAILRCQKAGNSKTGAFMFDHYLDSGRTFHGGSSTFPRLKLIEKPARRRQQRQ